jgi:SAM-dependent methyltransferase
MGDLVAEAYENGLKTHASGRLLDMGCGKVPLFDAYRRQVTSTECIDWAQIPHGIDHVDQICDLSDAIPYADNSFDTIILSDVLEHLPEPLNCWREMNRLLVPGGKVLLNVPFYYQLHEAPHDYYRYTEFALKRFAETTGFEVVELNALGGPVEILADVTGKLLASAKLNRAAVVAQSAARAFSKGRWGSRLSRRMSHRFPLAYFMVARKTANASPIG